MQKEFKNEVRKRQIELKRALETEFILTSRYRPIENSPKSNKDDKNTEKIKTTQGILGIIPVNTQNYSNAKLT